MITNKIDKVLSKAAKKTKTLQFAMNIPKLNITHSYSSTTPTQRFHSASVGKLMTTVLTFKAIELGLIHLDTPIYTKLDNRLLEQLFVFQGQDYKKDVTVRHLLGHTSGVNDYFEGKTIDGTKFIQQVIEQPDNFWKPTDLLDFTRTKQKAVAAPGQKFHYSDTGYILLGLLVEEILGMTFQDALSHYIFQPANMLDTALCFYGDGFDTQQLAPLYLNGTDTRSFTSLSCDFSGGGLSTSTADLMKFLNELQSFQLISEASLNEMAQFNQSFRRGLGYGLGMMELRFNEFSFLLKNVPRLRGHLGVTGVHAWYDPISKSSYVMNVGNTKDMVLSFRIIITIAQLVSREMRKVSK